MFSVLVPELITLEQRAVVASNLMEGLIMWPAMYTTTDQGQKIKGESHKVT